MRSASSSPLDRDEGLAKAFAIDAISNYDYDSVKDFVYRELFGEDSEGWIDSDTDQALYSDTVGQVCDALKRARVIVKFNGR